MNELLSVTGSLRNVKEFVDTNLPKMKKKKKGLIFSKKDVEIFKELQKNEGKLAILTTNDLSYITGNENKANIMGVFYKEFKTSIDKIANERLASFLGDSQQPSDTDTPSYTV